MIRLVQNFYFDNSPERRQEINSCIYKNNNLNLIDQFIILYSKQRFTFKQFFERINELTGPQDINIIANSDIYFDSTIELANKIKQNQCFALSRWDIQEDQTSKHFNREDSQDVWIFRGPIKENVFADFNMGFAGCDNRLAYELKQAGYKVLNPSFAIKTYHLQLSGVRNYDNTSKFLVPGPYLFVKPIYINL